MTVNMGMLDRAIRIVVGILLIAFAIPVYFPQTGWNWLGWIGVVPIVTALLGNCPAYTLLGVSTCSRS
ncbi:MAG: YgaP family membrane protein [Pseudomonadota bacterium]